MPPFHALAAGGSVLREEDSWGLGAFGAPRGERTHRGIDLVVAPGASVLAPLEGDIVREAAPYEDDHRYSGLLLRGTGPWDGLEVKLFYVEGPATGHVTPGQPLGVAQDLGAKYPGITNHVHVELRRGAELLDPTPLFKLSPDATS